MADSQDKIELSRLTLWTEFASYLTVPILLGVFVGLFFDRQFGFRFLFLIIGTVLGITIATIIIVQRALELIREAGKKKDIQ